MTTPSRSLTLVRSPKLQPARARWYRYYAGFAPEFVNDIYDAFAGEQGWSVVDPWMGSGTTLSVGAGRRIRVAGMDLNPAMVVVTQGRLVSSDSTASLVPLGEDLLNNWRSAAANASDPLRHWFDEPTARAIRGLADRILRVLVRPVKASETTLDPTGFSSLASFYCVALFEVTTAAVKSYISRNPTWVKRSKNYAGVVSLSRPQIAQEFRRVVKRLASYTQGSEEVRPEVRDSVDIRRASTTDIPFLNQQYDAVITSPPYLTRLDYVVGHAPELAILRWDGAAVRQLRSQMIGTPTMAQGLTPIDLGPQTEALLSRIEHHRSYASATYYAPNSRQYFTGMLRSLTEIDRITRPSADIVLVVQDSRFKDIHIDLAACLTDMASGLGWESADRKDFTNVRSMAQLNTNAHPLARTIKPIESVISFRKG